VWDKIPGPNGERYAEALSHGTLRVLLYAPRKTDTQEPHEQDEVWKRVAGKWRLHRDCWNSSDRNKTG
jgi:hypothetical protein